MLCLAVFRGQEAIETLLWGEEKENGKETLGLEDHFFICTTNIICMCLCVCAQSVNQKVSKSQSSWKLILTKS